MTQRLIARTVSMSLSALITLGMLGGIDHLAQPDAAAAGPQWAQAAAPRA